MSGRLSWQKILIICALFVAPLLLAQCAPAEGDNVASKTVGPEGPTSPSNYYFDLTVTPHTLIGGGWVHTIVKVWDQYGNEASGVLVVIAASGFDDVEMDPINGWTDANGMTYLYISIASDFTSIGYVTAYVEGEYLTAPIQIVTASSPTNG